jgi:hypothetical protein
VLLPIVRPAEYRESLIRTARVADIRDGYRSYSFVLREDRQRGCDVLQIGLMDCGSRYALHAVSFKQSEFKLIEHDSSCGQARDLQDNRRTYHSRPVSHTAPQTGKSISYLSHV